MGKNIKIIGAGIFGCVIGYELSRVGHSVTIIEQDSDIMQRASKCNHNRLHLGYHYPRSVETAKQSLEGLVTFLINYKDAIVTNFPNYYMVAKENSHINSKQYIDFCTQVNINYDIEYPSSNIINKDYIQTSLKTDEPIFDYDVLKLLVKNLIKNITIKFNTKFDGNISDCDYLINTTYAGVNKINKQLGIPKIPLRLQDVVVPYFKLDSNPFGVTIMDGPFCSILPKGKNKNEFLLYSVEHSLVKDNNLDINNIYKQSEVYFPFLKDVERLGYWRTTRALPINDNDERLSEIFTHPENPKVISVLSGKISTCHKIGQHIKQML